MVSSPLEDGGIFFWAQGGPKIGSSSGGGTSYGGPKSFTEVQGVFCVVLGNREHQF